MRVLGFDHLGATGPDQGTDGRVGLGIMPTSTRIVDRKPQFIEALSRIPGFRQDLPCRAHPHLGEPLTQGLLTLGTGDDQFLRTEVVHGTHDLLAGTRTFGLQSENFRGHSAAVHQHADPRILAQQVFVQRSGLARRGCRQLATGEEETPCAPTTGRRGGKRKGT